MGMVATWITAAVLASSAQAQAPNPVLPGGWGTRIHSTSVQDADLELMRNAGIRWVRVFVDWDSVERTEGVLDFSAYDSLINTLTPAGFRVSLVLDSRHLGFRDGTAHAINASAAFLRFAEGALLRYPGRGVLWEMCPEFASPDGQSPPDPERYIAKAREFVALAKRVAPGEGLVGPSSRGFDWMLLEASLEAGLLEGWSAVSVRPVGSGPPEAMLLDWARLRTLVDRHTPPGREQVPLISADWGLGGSQDPTVQDRQAMYLVRQYLAHRVAGVSVSFWSAWMDDPLGSDRLAAHSGMIRQDRSPKPAYHALRQLHGWINGFQYNKRLATSSPSSFRLLFTRGREARIVEWTSERGGTSWLTERPRLARSTSLPEPLLQWKALPMHWGVRGPEELSHLLLDNLAGLPGHAEVEVSERLEGQQPHRTQQFPASEASAAMQSVARGSRLFSDPRLPVRIRIRVTIEGQSLAQEVLVSREPVLVAPHPQASPPSAAGSAPRP